jgi:hypothetical protein
MAIDWVNFIEVGSTQYLWGTVSTTELQESDLGPVYAQVKFKISDNVCDPGYSQESVKTSKGRRGC